MRWLTRAVIVVLDKVEGIAEVPQGVIDGAMELEVLGPGSVHRDDIPCFSCRFRKGIPNAFVLWAYPGEGLKDPLGGAVMPRGPQGRGIGAAQGVDPGAHPQGRF